MKLITLIALNLIITTSLAESKVCEALRIKMSDDCDQLICGDSIADGTFKDMNECTSASDYAEYAQGACDAQPTLQDLVKEYNKKHPQTKIRCKE